MADYMVIRRFNPNTSERFFEEMLYRDGQEEAFVKEGMKPGIDFVKVTDEGDGSRARRQAEAYVDGTHKNPGVIDGWVRSLDVP